MRRVLLACWVALWVMLAPTRGHALSCQEVTLSQRLDRATAVFVGEVEDQQVIDDEQVARFVVRTAFKGVSEGDEVVVRAPSMKYMWKLLPGGRFLIFADGERDALTTGPCHGDLDLEQSPEDVAQVLDQLAALVKPEDAVEPAPAVSVVEIAPPAPTAKRAPAPARTGAPGCAGCGVAADPAPVHYGWLAVAIGWWCRRRSRRATLAPHEAVARWGGRRVAAGQRARARHDHPHR